MSEMDELMLSQENNLMRKQALLTEALAFLELVQSGRASFALDDLVRRVREVLGLKREPQELGEREERAE